MLQTKQSFNFKYIIFNKVLSYHKNICNSKLKQVFYKYPLKRKNAFLYKKLAFIGLSLSVVSYNKFFLSKFKSLLYVSWSAVSTYTFIF